MFTSEEQAQETSVTTLRSVSMEMMKSHVGLVSRWCTTVLIRVLCLNDFFF